MWLCGCVAMCPHHLSTYQFPPLHQPLHTISLLVPNIQRIPKPILGAPKLLILFVSEIMKNSLGDLVSTSSSCFVLVWESEVWRGKSEPSRETVSFRFVRSCVHAVSCPVEFELKYWLRPFPFFLCFIELFLSPCVSAGVFPFSFVGRSEFDVTISRSKKMK